MIDGRRLLKFKYGSSSEGETKRVFVKFEKERDDNQADIFTFECDDDAHPDLKKAPEAMVPHLLENCEIKAEEGYKIAVRSVTSTYKEMEDGTVHGLVISGLRELRYSRAPLVLTSPHKTDIPYSEGDEDAPLLTSACLGAFDDLESEVFAYVDGKRAQGELDFGQKDPAA